MTAEHYVALAVSAFGAVAIVVASILPSLIKMRHANTADHARVMTSVELLAVQLDSLTNRIIDVSARLDAHTAWEEGQKYATPDHIERLIVAVKKGPTNEP